MPVLSIFDQLLATVPQEFVSAGAAEIRVMMSRSCLTKINNDSILSSEDWKLFDSWLGLASGWPLAACDKLITESVMLPKSKLVRIILYCSTSSCFLFTTDSDMVCGKLIA